MKASVHLFSTGNWHQDVILYALMGLLIFANMQLISYKQTRSQVHKA